MSNVNRMVKIARIHRHKTDEYKTLHDSVPKQIVKHLTDSGIKVLEIYLLDDILVMVLEIDPADKKHNSQVDEEQEENWENVTSACFQSYWQDAELIYDIKRHLIYEERER